MSCLVDDFGDAVYPLVVAAGPADRLVEVIDHGPWPSGNLAKKAFSATHGTSSPSVSAAAPVVASRHCWWWWASVITLY